MATRKDPNAFISRINHQFCAMMFSFIDNSLRDFVMGVRKAKPGNQSEAKLKGIFPSPADTF